MIFRENRDIIFIENKKARKNFFMKLIVRPQCTGKTKELIAYAIENNIPILCLSQSKIKSLNEKAEIYFNSVVPTCTLNDLSEDVIPNVLIDDADSFINELIGLMSAYDTCVSGITLTV